MAGTLVVATLSFARADLIAFVVNQREDLDEAPEAFVAAVRLRNGRLHDDVALVVMRSRLLRGSVGAPGPYFTSDGSRSSTRFPSSS